mmetsp:Transcript_27099/g.48899  ORF Transcript_27099/g.48899 Transcript_27099/m.48899 type:complete len:82 (+) Transcript_27099:280-525(+)
MMLVLYLKAFNLPATDSVVAPAEITTALLQKVYSPLPNVLALHWNTSNVPATDSILAPVEITTLSWLHLLTMLLGSMVYLH